MSFNFEKFCLDKRISIAQRGAKHHRHGWVNIECPFCTGNRGFHMGFNIENNFITCHRCGWHPIEKVISELSGKTGYQLKTLIRNYYISDPSFKKEYQPRPTNLILPDNLNPLSEHHKNYLIRRKFDSDKLINDWGLLGTNHSSFLTYDNNTIDYKCRILAPIDFKYDMVSFQTRDITNKHPAKYMACPEPVEIIPHKHILYGWDECPTQNQTCIVVEGITGVWRIGFGCLATFGSSPSTSQIRLLAKRFKRICILYDPDEAGEKGADKLSIELMGMGREVEIYDFLKDFDSGNMPQFIADDLKKEVLG